jgi:hypothetical protein
VGVERRWRLLVGLALALVVTSTAAAIAERHQQGDLTIALDGGITPSALPRHRAVAATATISSELSTTDGSPPPRTRRIKLELAGHSVRFDRAGLPSCPLGRLRNATASQAISRCGSALVGQGRLDAILLLPHQAPLPIRARLLDFNGRSKSGRPAIQVHVFSARPPAAFVLSFLSRHGDGDLGNVLTAEVPRAASPWTRLTGFRMTLGRRFSSGGERRSYLNASCPAPPRFTAAFLPVARATYSFVGGGSISTSIVRGCRVDR